MYCFYWVDVTMYITRNAHLLLRSVFECVSLLFFSMYSMQSTHQQKREKEKKEECMVDKHYKVAIFLPKVESGRCEATNLSAP